MRLGAACAGSGAAAAQFGGGVLCVLVAGVVLLTRAPAAFQDFETDL